MNPVTVGIVDYDMGNHASVVNSLRDLGYRVRISSDPVALDATDVLILPGVGAFPVAMLALQQRGLIPYLRQQAKVQRPMIGICLGMQLLATSSREIEYTQGLDIIPGEVVQMSPRKWHTGWDVVQSSQPGTAAQSAHGQFFYFNHSYCYQGASEYHFGMSGEDASIVAAIKCGKVVGVQFHPEKSQQAGKSFLAQLIGELVNG